MSDAVSMDPPSRAPGRGRGAASRALLRNPAVVCLAVAAIASAALLIWLGSHLVLFGDEWNVVLGRGGSSAGTFLDPYNGHLAAGLIVVYKLLLAAFGMDSPLPFHVLSTVVYVLAAVLLFVYARRRVGDLLSLLGTTMILFFGASAVDLLSPFQMFFSGSLAAGIGALLALDREDRRGDAIACLLLLVAISFSEVGIAFSVGALVRLALDRKPMAPRLYVVLVPFVLYAAWWLGWGHKASSDISFHTLATTPAYVLDATGTALGALLGLTSAADQLPDPVGQDWAPVALVATLLLAAWRVRRQGSVPSGVWPVLAIGLTFWILAGLNENDLRPPDSARYLYPSAVLIMLITAELLRGVRVGWRGLATAATVAAIGIAANLAFLSDSYKLFWKPGSEAAQAQLRALEIAGPVNPALRLHAGVRAVPGRDLPVRGQQLGLPGLHRAGAARSSGKPTGRCRQSHGRDPRAQARAGRSRRRSLPGRARLGRWRDRRRAGARKGDDRGIVGDRCRRRPRQVRRRPASPPRVGGARLPCDPRDPIGRLQSPLAPGALGQGHGEGVRPRSELNGSPSAGRRVLRD